MGSSRRNALGGYDYFAPNGAGAATAAQTPSVATTTLMPTGHFKAEDYPTPLAATTTTCRTGPGRAAVKETRLAGMITFGATRLGSSQPI